MSPHAVPYSDAEVPAISGVIDRLPSDEVPFSRANVPNGDHTFVSLGHHDTGSKSSRGDHVIPVHDQLAFTPRKLRVITVGAGFSGLMVAQKFQHRYPEMQNIVEHKIFEARNDIGGTWLLNTYPGVQCDVPSHIYVRFSTRLPTI